MPCPVMPRRRNLAVAPRGHRSSFLAGLIMGCLCCLLMVGATGCNGDGLRSLDAVNAEQESLNATKPFSVSHVEKFPQEKQSVDDFYTSWQGRINKEKAAASAK